MAILSNTPGTSFSNIPGTNVTVGQLQNRLQQEGYLPSTGSGGSSSTGSGGSSSTGSRDGKQGGNGLAWAGLATEWFNTLPSLIQSITGKYPSNNYYEENNNSNSKTWVIVMGVAVVAIVLIVLLTMRK